MWTRGLGAGCLPGRTFGRGRGCFTIPRPVPVSETSQGSETQNSVSLRGVRFIAGEN